LAGIVGSPASRHKWKQAWYFGDELGLLLQLGFVDTLQA
jgi:hypothetical protein